MKTIIVTGTPGTGKTEIAKKLAKRLKFYYLDVNKVISSYKLAEGHDRKRKTKIVDIKKLNKFLINKIKAFKKTNIAKNKIKKYNGIIIDSHLSHYLPRKYADFCIVTKCNIKELNKRLKRKKFNKNKIRENIQTEIFNVCLEEAKRKKHKIIEIDTTKGFNISSVLRQLGG
ncbi:adenylate kinase family protein [Candidatus Woesearchaeota archaeon]|nr:adenylate kinase family protein [Candidatus Woesearchaeota archaeon]